MKNKTFWKFAIQTAISVLSAIATALCMKQQKRLLKRNASGAIIIYISPDKEKKQKMFGSSDFLLYICRKYT